MINYILLLPSFSKREMIQRHRWSTALNKKKLIPSKFQHAVLVRTSINPRGLFVFETSMNHGFPAGGFLRSLDLWRSLSPHGTSGDHRHFFQLLQEIAGLRVWAVQSDISFRPPETNMDTKNPLVVERKFLFKSSSVLDSYFLYQITHFFADSSRLSSFWCAMLFFFFKMQTAHNLEIHHASVRILWNKAMVFHGFWIMASSCYFLYKSFCQGVW